MLLPMSALVLMLGVGLVFVLFLPFWWLILFDLSLARMFGNWSIGFLRIGPNDLLIVFIVLAILLRGQRSEEWHRSKIPLLLPWVLMAILLCLSYLYAPINQRNLTDPIRIGYQLLRYCIRPLIYLPIAMILLRTPKRAYTTLNFVVLAAVLCAFEAIQQGYSGFSNVPGPFRTGNQLGGALVMPIMICVVSTMFPRNRRHLIFSVISLGLLLRAMLFSGSRGAMVACFGASLVLVTIVLLRDVGRRRMRYLSPFLAIGLILALPLLPYIAKRPTVAHALSASSGSKDSTWQWRIQERWPHFWGIAVANPLFGIGTGVDTSLGETANTPHNGFLSLLVMWGFPAFGLLLFFIFRTIRNGIRLYLHAPDPDHKIFGITAVVAISGILTHQLVDVTLNAPFTFKVFWLWVAMTEMAKRWPDPPLPNTSDTSDASRSSDSSAGSLAYSNSPENAAALPAASIGRSSDYRLA